MNVVYNASAGTGKTYEVTRLYVERVMEDDIDPCSILLMTFTENAAAELRMRVAQRLLKARHAAESSGDGLLTERAIRALNHLPSAPIGTIHSYCTRLLREHALDAGLSPGFSVLDEEERTEMLNQICRDELLVRLDKDADLRAFCSGTQVIGTGNGFGVSVAEAVPRLINEAGSLGISLAHAESMLPEPVPPAARSDFELICQRIKELPRITPTVRKALNIIEQSLKETADIESLVDRMEELGIEKFGRGAKEISEDFWALKESVTSAVRYRARHPLAKAFVRYAQAAASAFQQRKHEMDAVDFDDQLRMAAALLESGKVRPSFRYVIVDEVQDTSRVQCRLIESLWKAAGTEYRTARSDDDSSDDTALPPETQLVICGDKKQSIYTWRGADPQVMPDLQKMILDAGGKPENLQISYRSNASILNVVNTLFSEVYDPADYTEADRLLPNPAFSVGPEEPCVEFLEADCDEELSVREKVKAEMTAVANRIRLLVDKSGEWAPVSRYDGEKFSPTSGDNVYRYSDILILLRRTTHQPALEQALRHAGIPYTLGGKGRGLFSRQETRDVSLFLNAITNPKDVYSLIGFLRSPWIGLSDETIAELAWSEDGFSVDNLLATYPTETDVVERYRQLLGTKLASELVRMLIDETGYDALLAGLPRGEQRLANLRKTLDWLREAERGARTTPAAAARKLAEKIAHPPNVPEAALLDPNQNAVTIMTVHGAKGLTKRVVFLPDTSSSANNDSTFARIFSDERNKPSLGIKITAADKSAVESPGFKTAMERVKAARNHEFNNLFYVAMTRARNLVVTTATVGSRSAGWYKTIEPFIGSLIPAISYSTLTEAAGAPVAAGRRPVEAAELRHAFLSLPPAPGQPEWQRISATRLARERDEQEPFGPAESTCYEHTDNATARGSLAHAVLEQLALNNWEGSVAEWIETLRNDFSLSKAEAGTLEDRIEQTRCRMIELTGGMPELRPEYPFVLHEDGLLIDGTIDLLCRSNDDLVLFDYKFTEVDDATAAAHYEEQMRIYRLAAERLYPEVSSITVQLVVVSSSGPRLVKLPSAI